MTDNSSSGEPRTTDTVLVIDDSAIECRVMDDLLVCAGYRVVELTTPIGATRLAREIQARVVVLDHHMAALDGLKLAAVLRRTPSLKGIKIVLMSSDKTVADMVDSSCIDAFVDKERMHLELESTVRRLCES